MEFMEEERRQSEEYARISLGMANLIISTTGIMGNEQEQCQLPADTEQHDRQRNVGQHVHDKVGNAINEEAADTLCVIVDAVDKPSGRVLIEVGKRLVLHGAEDIILHIAHQRGWTYRR